MNALAENITEHHSIAQGRKGAPALSPTDFAELLATFHEATARLQGTHETLRAEVARLESELREANDQLRRARQLAALGEMAAGIAHEVRNPLGSIRLYAGVLATDLADRPSERDIALKIAAAVSGLDAVVGDVLAFSRDMKLRPESVPVIELINEAADACADLWSTHAITLHRPRPARHPLTLHCDRHLMHQALTNVLRNAAESLAESPASTREVWCAAAQRRVATIEGRREPMIVLSIRDNGPGVPPEALERLFNPFFTTRHTGTGLGLAIVHRIIDAHAGRVTIENNTTPGADSQPPRGATVQFALPIAPSLIQTSPHAGTNTTLQSEAA
ncbi:MAG: hypothetical protein JNK58_10480 [Phycisphaerae bacterium]|nr:hypothetical protein [Phycisphaerae bacterium]